MDLIPNVKKNKTKTPFTTGGPSFARFVTATYAGLTG